MTSSLSKFAWIYAMAACSLLVLSSGVLAVLPQTNATMYKRINARVKPWKHARVLDEFEVGAVDSEETPKPRFDPNMASTSTSVPEEIDVSSLLQSSINTVLSTNVGTQFDGVRFEQSLAIPADPMGAAGPSSVVQVVNNRIEARTRGGIVIWSTSLVDFFGHLGVSRAFSTKIVFDQNENRFVVTALDISVASHASSILLAVSKTDAPSGINDWYFAGINSSIEGTFADSLGFEVDEEVLYITANMFAFSTSQFSKALLWVVNKGRLYTGREPVVAVYDFPFNNFGAHTPAAIRPVDGAGSNVGTYLVSHGFSGLQIISTTEQILLVTRIDRPRRNNIGFTTDIVRLGIFSNGDFDVGVPLLDAPQRGFAGRPVGIETNDRRILDAAWHGGSLWATSTFSLQGVTKAVWFKIDTSNVADDLAPPGLLFLDDFGVINGDDIGPSTSTFSASVAVNDKGVAALGFSASSLFIFAGAYITWLQPNSNTAAPSRVLREGVSPYVRTFGGGKNSWGSYSGAAVDPLDENCFWMTNQFAGIPCFVQENLEFGCWNTAWARLCVDPGADIGNKGPNLGSDVSSPGNDEADVANDEPAAEVKAKKQTKKKDKDD